MKKWRITPAFAAMVCLLGWLRLSFCLRFLLCVLVHEMGHLAAMALMHQPIRGVAMTCAGARISTDPMPPAREALSALAGPMANLLLAGLLHRRDADAALISLFLAAVNLLPIYPMDGGRILHAVLLVHLRPERAEQVGRWTNYVLCSLLMVGACWIAAALQAGLWPIFAAMLLLWRAADAEKRLQFCGNHAKMKKPD